MNEDQAQALLHENNRVALVLAMNAILALSNAKLLLPAQAERCAQELRNLAAMWEEASGPNDLPGKLTVDLQSVAALLDPKEKPRPS